MPADGGDGIADGGNGTADGGDGNADGGDGAADGGRGTPSNVSHTAPISAISDITNKVRAFSTSCFVAKRIVHSELDKTFGYQ